MKRSTTLFITTLVLIACATACKKSPTPINSSAPGTSISQDFQHAQGGMMPAGETRYFKGSIGSTLGLQMKLLREGETLTGSYFYQKVGTKIELRGTIDKDGNITLEEFDPKGKQSGVFTGLWKLEPDSLTSIAGNWSKPNSDKKTAFSLHEEPIAFTNGAEVVSKRIKESNRKLKYEIDADYPQLTGATDPNLDKFNQAARTLVTRKVGEFRKEMAPEEEVEAALETNEINTEGMGSDLGIGYTVALAKDDLISIQFDISSYYQGAAHPNSYTDVVNFDLKNGKSIRLADLFNVGSKYLQTIAAYCIQDLKKQSKAKGDDAMLDDDWIGRGAGASGENYDSWTITKQGLKIHFDPYQVAPYAAGPQQSTIPYSTLKDIIKADGPLGQFVK